MSQLEEDHLSSGLPLNDSSVSPWMGWLKKIVGVGFCGLAIMIGIGLYDTPNLMFDERGRTGFVAGGICVGVLLMLGLYLVAGSSSPRSLEAWIYLSFGFLSALLGTSLIGWITYNLFIERLEAFPETIFGQMLTPFVLLSAGISMLRQGWRRLRGTQAADTIDR